MGLVDWLSKLLRLTTQALLLNTTLIMVCKSYLYIWPGFRLTSALVYWPITSHMVLGCLNSLGMHKMNAALVLLIRMAFDKFSTSVLDATFGFSCTQFQRREEVRLLQSVLSGFAACDHRNLDSYTKVSVNLCSRVETWSLNCSKQFLILLIVPGSSHKGWNYFEFEFEYLWSGASHMVSCYMFYK